MNERRRAAAIAALALVGACVRAPQQALAGPADFTIRGRLESPHTVTWRVDAERAPVPAAAFTRAVHAAAAAWNASGVVTLRAAAPGEAATVTLSFRRGHHGACEPFGPSADVAHTGPCGPGTFVHFDAGRRWSERGDDGLSLFHTALHELGHVLGLGHAEVDAAVMSNAVVRPGAPSAHDLAGLQSLYGDGGDGGAPAPGDVRVVDAHGRGVATLCGVAPPACCACAVFDVDGAGGAEVLVWRTDAAGHGTLRVFGFAAGPALTRTIGPFYGVVVPGADVGFTVAGGGERLLVTTLPDGRRRVRQFDRFGVPEPPAVAFADDVLARAARATTGDLDNDGTVERVDVTR